MRNTIICTLLLLIFMAPAEAQVRFGVKAGLNLATVSGTADFDDFFKDDYLGESFKPTILPTFLIGAQVEFDFGTNIGIGTGLQISGKGFKMNETILVDGERATYDEKNNMVYLQIPVNFLYHNNGFFGAIGPYVGYGIGGRYDWEFDSDTDRILDDGKIEYTNTIDVDDDIFSLVSKVRPFDFGAGIELGYEFTNLRLTAGFNMGISNVFPKDLVELADLEGNYDNFKISHRVFSIGAAWMFGERAAE
ncbi:MAG: porin family protein [Saprospiraceae bacterium]|nr:PorT family protein [Saprospiraceae bacterium]MCB9344352.1 PorT family protein [Lewinellaceae bacterium]